MKFKMVVSLGLTVFLVGLQAAEENQSWIPTADTEQQIVEWMEQLSVPGASIAVVENGEVAWHQHFGFSNIEDHVPVSDKTLFEAASMSKPVFAYLVMQLGEQGLIDLHRPLVDYHRPDYVIDSDFANQITALDILRHTSGLPNWASGAEEMLSPAFQPGSGYRYSGEGFIWLQTVVEEQTGQSLEQLAQRFILRPAGMINSSFAWSEHAQKNAAYGYLAPDQDSQIRQGFQFRRNFFGPMLTIAADWDKPLRDWSREDELRAHPIQKNLPETVSAIAEAEIERYRVRQNRAQNSAGGLITQARDYARFLTLFMFDTSKAPWMISSAARDRMLTRQALTNNHFTNQGLGWRTELTPRGKLFFHGGNNGDQFRSFALANPETGNGIVILTNGGNGHRLYRAIVEKIVGIELADLSDVEPLEARSASNAIFPRESWEYWLAGDATGFDQPAIDQLRQNMIDDTSITGALIVTGGKVLLEVGDVTELSYVASVRKSILGMLYGRHVAAGAIDLDVTLESLQIEDLQQLSIHEKQATVGHLLASRSGVYHDASNDGDDADQAPVRDSVSPGSQFLYNNWDFNAAGSIFERLTGQSVYDALEFELARPIGMQDFDRAQQVKSGDPTRSLHPAYHMVLSTRDMARIGYLMLHKGRWQDIQVIPESWVEASTSLVTTANDMLDDSNQPLGYGLMWWVWDTDKNPDSPFEGAFLARGYWGQTIAVLPALDAVVAIKTKDRYARKTDGSDIYQILLALAAAHR